ncbi:MAG: hypothetical protein CSA11_11800 [Chloroflexi bacterium]|nr:MAG: hypothetical protein CSA11_11800 [Chloroflexota bacterium]
MNSIKKLFIMSMFAGLAVTAQASDVDVIDDIRVSPTVINNYETVAIEIDWSKPPGVTINNGDTFRVGLPGQMQTNDVLGIEMLNAANQKVGECDLIAQKIFCTFTANNVINGSILFTRSFYDASVTADNTPVETIFEVNEAEYTRINMTVSPALIDPNEILVKFGSPQGGSTIGEKFDWYVRANCRGDTINNFQLSDQLNVTGHSIIANTISITEGTCDGSGFNWERDLVLNGAVNTGTTQDYVADWDINTGEVTLTMNNATDKAYEIIFSTEITADQAEWNNEVTLTGDGVDELREAKIEKQTIIIIGNQEGTVAGVVFLDADNDGVADAGEGIANVDVVVTDSSGTPITVTTDADGNWSQVVGAGLVEVNVNTADPDIPAGVVQSVGNNPTSIEVPGDDIARTEDGFAYPMGTASGVVFLDANANGVADAGEGIANIDVVVNDSSGTPITVATDGNGYWSTPVRAGNVVATVDASDPDMPANVDQSVGDNPTTLTVPVNSSAETSDGFVYQMGTASGVVFLDANTNGVADAGEGIANVDVVVTHISGTAITVSTDANGNWSTPVRVGDVNVAVDIADPDMPLGVTQSVGDNPSTLTVPVGGSATTTDGFVAATQMGAASGIVFLDANGNGSFDSGEGIANIDVVVVDSSNTPITLVTDGNGHWSTPVRAGGVVATVDTTDADMPAGVEQTVGDNPSTLTVPVNGLAETSDGFVYQMGTVSGIVFLDANGNGGFDPGEGIADIDVLVTDRSGTPMTVVTDSNGNWSTSVRAGDVNIVVDTTDPNMPAGVVQSVGENPSADYRSHG